MPSYRRYLLAGAALLGFATAAKADNDNGRFAPKVDHVLLISIDGMHEVDLRLWVKSHPNGALAQLSKHGTTYSQAYTTAPSDSFPGMIAQVTGGTPYSAGVFYDDSYDRTFFAPGSGCAGTPGAETTFAEILDRSLADVTGGGTLGNPISQINPANLPLTKVDGDCVAVWPHQFIRVNTLFEVLRADDRHTAWSDKHPAYEILNGPSGTGIEDLFTPEINSQLPGGAAGDDNTTSFKGTRDYDQIKVNAVLNWIAAKDSTGHIFRGYIPAIFGMNFQAVSVGQKLKHGYQGLESTSLLGGYLDANGTPGNALTRQLQFVDDSIGAMVKALHDHNLDQHTAIIISAKHGQSPIDPSKLQRIPDTYSKVLANDGYSFNIADDASLIWLDPNQRTPATLAAAAADLKANAGAFGIDKVLDRDELRRFFRDPATDSRTPDFFVVSDHGVVYTTGSKLAEHGGVADDDRHVAMLVSSPGLDQATADDQVQTTQIAPTILRMLSEDPNDLQAVKIEHTRVLPGLSE